jgi:hypothetical protein
MRLRHYRLKRPFPLLLARGACSRHNPKNRKPIDNLTSLSRRG